MPSILGRAVVLVIASAAAAACTKRPASPVAGQVRPPRVVQLAPKAAESPTVVTPPERPGVECSGDVDCANLPAVSGRVMLCENRRCEAYDDAVALRWAAALLPALDDLKPNREFRVSDAPWYHEGARARLYVRGDWRERRPLPSQCVALDFVASDGTLIAEVGRRGGSRPRAGCGARLLLDSGVALFDSGCTSADGSSVGLSDDEMLHEGRALSSVDAKGLVYDGMRVTATPRCDWISVDRSGCSEPACRTCRLFLDVKGRAGSQRFVTRPPREIHDTSANPGCGPCLPDRQGAELPRLSAILRGRSFLSTDDQPDALRFFKAKPDCDAYVRDARAHPAEG